MNVTQQMNAVPAERRRFPGGPSVALRTYAKKAGVRIRTRNAPATVESSYEVDGEFVVVKDGEQS
ncbi:hypothetical protein [Antribacter gilvus]|uniref:hypothetical protein n=1 Tax=Antribacter gilvus TaxID=2304675 RepID=UPI000F78BE05|nr:hypothetical protein [Antribacter gilvus]